MLIIFAFLGGVPVQSCAEVNTSEAVTRPRTHLDKIIIASSFTSDIPVMKEEQLQIDKYTDLFVY